MTTHTQKNIKKKPAFTLLEILAVLTIIGLMAYFTLNTRNNIQQQQTQSLQAAYLETTKTALEHFHAINGHYPKHLKLIQEFLNPYHLNHQDLNLSYSPQNNLQTYSLTPLHP